MRFETITALVIGLLLPLLETYRRGISHWAIDFTTMFEDYVGGALLLIGAWASHRKPRWGVLLLLVSWSCITALMSISLCSQIEDTIRGATEPNNVLVVAVKSLLWVTAVASLFMSFRTGFRMSNADDEKER